jgi:hypothetical protein
MAPRRFRAAVHARATCRCRPQPPVRITKAELPHQTEAMSRLEKLAEEIRANNRKLTTAQAFSKALQRPEGQELYRHDKSERLGTAVARAGFKLLDK